MFRWLPDAELDPHPRLTWCIEYTFGLVMSALYRIDPIYPPGYRLAPGTLVVSNHQRDVDIPILAPVLCRREAMRLNWPLPFFASREALFRRDFLNEYLHDWPRPLRYLLGQVPITRLLHVVRVEPIRRVREYSLDEAFSTLPDTNDTTCWLNARGRHELTADHVDTPNHRNLPPERQAWGLRRLHCEARRILEPEFRATIDAQLDRLAGLLDAGRIVFLAPEGRNSLDGRFGRIRAGAWELVQRCAAPPPIQPLALSYDALQAGRLRAIVHVGNPLASYCAASRRQLDAMLEMQIRKLYPVNASHLISRFLVSGPTTFGTGDFAHWLGHGRSQLENAGFVIDPRLAHSDTGTLAAKRLNWLRRASLVERTHTGWHNRWPGGTEANWRKPANIVRYCNNALDDYLNALAPATVLQP